jgi:hypothetical protein
VHTIFWEEYLGERHHLDDLGLDGRIILRQDFKKCWGKGGIDGFIRLRKGTGAVILLMR